MGDKPLSPQHEAFVEYYIRSWNAAEAAIQAGYSPNGAYVQGSRLLTNVNIKRAIQERIQSLCMGTDEWMTRITAQARGDIGEVVEEDGTINLRSARRRNQSRLISEYQVEESYRKGEDGEAVPVTKIKVKLYSAQQALRMIGQRLGVLESDNAALLRELNALLAEHKLTDLKKKEALLDLLQKKAPALYKEVLRILTGGPEESSAGEDINLQWDDAPNKEDLQDQASEASPAPGDDR